MIYYVGKERTDVKFKRASIQEVLEYFKSKEIVEVDTETEGFDPHTKQLLCWQVGDTENQFVIDEKEYPLKNYKEFFEDKNKLFIFQNAKFDLRFFYKNNIYIHNVYDTYLVERILTLGDKTARKSLDFLVSKYCKVDSMDKTIRGQIHWRGLDNIVIDYAANDVAYLSIIRKKQLKEARKLDLTRVVKLENRFVKVLAYIEFCGFYLDKNQWQTKVNKSQELLNSSKKALDDYVISNGHLSYVDTQMNLFAHTEPRCTINWNSTQQVAAFFYNKLGIDCRVYENGKVKFSTDKEVLGKSNHEIIPLFNAYSEYQKDVSTYGTSFFRHVNKETGRIHTQFTQIMETGRLSSGGRDGSTGQETVNFQNIPADPDTRSCFKAEPGNVLIVSDYSGQEQVVLANLSKDKDLINFYEQGFGDMHSYVASRLFPQLRGLTLEEIKKDHKDLRQLAKIAGFAINYGGNGFTIARQLQLPESQGNALYEDYFRGFPGLKNYFQACNNSWRKHGYILYNGLDRRKLFIDLDWFHKNQLDQEYWDEYSFQKAIKGPMLQELIERRTKYNKFSGALDRKSLNYPIQGTSASITKLAGIFFYDWIIENNYQGIIRIPNVVHDEYVVECPRSMAEKTAAKLKECMESAGDYYCKIVPLKAEPEITQFWKK